MGARSSMLAVPKAASASPFDFARRGRLSWGKDRRLLRKAEFDAFFPPQGSWRASGKWIAVSVRFHPIEPFERTKTGVTERKPATDFAPGDFVPGEFVPAEFASGFRDSASVGRGRPPSTRFGFLVAKRHARRAVVRNMIRRILRESARHRCSSLDGVVNRDRAAPDFALHILMRLKAPLPEKADPRTWQAVKHDLRVEVDGLLSRLERAVRTGRGPGHSPRHSPDHGPGHNSRPDPSCSAVTDSKRIPDSVRGRE